MTLRLKNIEDAEKILDYFNGFHDGFIHELCLQSHDSFSQDGTEITDIAHHLTGEFDVTLTIAHYNYGQGTQPYNRVVRCQFKLAKDFHFDLRQVQSCEWPIKNVEIQPIQRLLDTGAEENSLALIFIWGKLVNNQWETYQKQILTFIEAEFEEALLEE